MRTLLAVPNFSEGRDRETVNAVATAMIATVGVRLLDVHSDFDHHRSVYTLAASPVALVDGLLAGVRAAFARTDLTADMLHDDGPQSRGQHPFVGVLDVAPFVYLDEADRGAAAAAALLFADRLAQEQRIPVFLYGSIAAGRSRAQLRKGGLAALAQRISDGEIAPDFGADCALAGHGATLVGARAPLVAFNAQLASPAGIAEARSIAAKIREGGSEGLPGLRAIGVQLHSRGQAQVSMNVEDPIGLPLRTVVAAIARHAQLASAELVGLAPTAAFDGFPADVPLIGFNPERQLFERALQMPVTH